jgi:hypothetical protein
MRHTREILRQKWALGRTPREVAQSLGISSGAVRTTMLRAQARRAWTGPRWRPWPTPRSKPGCTAARKWPARGVGRGRTAPGFTPGPQARGHAGAAPPRVPRSAVPTAIVTPNSARSSGAGSSGAGYPCARSIAPVTSALSTRGQKPRVIDPHRRGRPGRTLRRRPRRLQLHLRRGDGHPARAASPCPAATNRGCSAPTRSSPSTTAS